MFRNLTNLAKLLLQVSLPQEKLTVEILYELFPAREMFSAALMRSWKVGVVRMALHTQNARQSYCFGNFPRERGLVITWFTPTPIHQTLDHTGQCP